MGQITAKVVPESARIDFIPSRLPGMYLSYETGVYSKMREIARNYNGGHWDMYELSNGSFYMAPPSPHHFQIEIPSNSWHGEVSADAAGIIVSMFSLNVLCWIKPSEYLNNLYYALRDYAAEHPEGASIFGAID